MSEGTQLSAERIAIEIGSYFANMNQSKQASPAMLYRNEKLGHLICSQINSKVELPEAPRWDLSRLETSQLAKRVADEFDRAIMFCIYFDELARVDNSTCLEPALGDNTSHQAIDGRISTLENVAVATARTTEEWISKGCRVNADLHLLKLHDWLFAYGAPHHYEHFERKVIDPITKHNTSIREFMRDHTRWPFKDSDLEGATSEDAAPYIVPNMLRILAHGIKDPKPPKPRKVQAPPYSRTEKLKCDLAKEYLGSRHSATIHGVERPSRHQCCKQVVIDGKINIHHSTLYQILKEGWLMDLRDLHTKWEFSWKPKVSDK